VLLKISRRRILWGFCGDCFGFDNSQIPEECLVECTIGFGDVEGIVPKFGFGELFGLGGGGEGGGDFDGEIGNVGVDDLVLGGAFGVTDEDDLPTVDGVGGEGDREGLGHESGLALERCFPDNFVTDSFIVPKPNDHWVNGLIGDVPGEFWIGVGGLADVAEGGDRGKAVECCWRRRRSLGFRWEWWGLCNHRLVWVDILLRRSGCRG
jgi:hypothetical protein